MSSWERFNQRSKNYEMHRPRYPNELLDLLVREVNLDTESSVADVGSGTGLLSELLLKSGCKLFCIEPNEEMRKISMEKFGMERKCKILNGTAENTSLPDGSMDVVTVGQAFHWFEPTETKREFRRILRRNGKVVLVWNTRTESSSGINSEYERLVKQYSKDYRASGTGHAGLKGISDFYGGKLRHFKIKNYQKLDLSGLVGRYLSASYAIAPNDSRYEKIRQDFESVFAKYENNGEVVIEYETEVFVGAING